MGGRRGELVNLQLVVLEGGNQVLLAKDGQVLLVQTVCALGIWPACPPPHQPALVKQDVQELSKGEGVGGVCDRDNVGDQLTVCAVFPHHQLLIFLPVNGCFKLLHV